MKKVLCGVTAILVFFITACMEYIPGSEIRQDSLPAATITEPETELKDNLPESLKYDGVTFNMLSPDNFYGTYFVQEQNGEVVNDAIYNAKINIEDRLKITITETLHDMWTISSAVNELVYSNDSTYDAVTNIDSFIVEMMQNGLILPLDTIEYLDLSAPYWGFTDSMSINGHIYFAASTFNQRAYKLLSCVIFNTGLMSSMGIAENADLYDMTYNGTWTYEALNMLASQGSVDLNGDTEMDENDQYGLYSGNIASTLANGWVACGELLLKKDNGDIPYFAAGSSTRFMDACGLIHDIFMDKSYVYKKTYALADLFVKGQSVFAEIDISMFDFLRDMKDDFGVLPLPKFDEAQAEYHSRTCQPMVFMVLQTCKDTSFTGAVLEVLSFEGYKNVVPAYLDDTLKYKYQRDEDSIQILDLIFSSMTIDLGETYLSEYFSVEDTYKILSANSFNPASFFAQNETVIQASLNEIIDIMIQ